MRKEVADLEYCNSKVVLIFNRCTCELEFEVMAARSY